MNFNIQRLLRHPLGGIPRNDFFLVVIAKFGKKGLKQSLAQKTPSLFKSEKGMTLLEIVLATVIFATALAALAMSLGQGVRAFTASNNMQAALIVAQQRMVEWKLSSTGETTLLGSQQGERTVFNRKFLWQHDIEVTEDPEVLKSTVTVQWGTGPQAQERKFATLISAKPPKAEPATEAPATPN